MFDMDPFGDKKVPPHFPLDWVAFSNVPMSQCPETCAEKTTQLVRARTCPKIPGTCYFWKKKAPARQPRVVVGMGFYRNPSKSKIFPNNMEKYPTQNDATDHIYRLGPPKPICLFKNNLFLLEMG